MPLKLSLFVLPLLLVVGAQCNMDDGSAIKSVATTAAAVKGNIDGVRTRDGSFQISGWACDEGVAQSIQIHVYAGGSSGTGTLVKGDSANNSSEPAVGHTCGTQGIMHRFSVTFTPNQLRAAADKTIYIHGISTRSRANHIISKSGQFRFPSAPVEQLPQPRSVEIQPAPVASTPAEPALIKGRIDRAQIVDGRFVISGWACDQTVNRSINIHLYVGGASGTGTIVGEFTANNVTDDGVNRACHTTDAEHRFSMSYALSDAANYAGQAIHIHGMSLSSGANSQIAGSGEFSVPTAAVLAANSPATPLSSFLQDHPGRDVTIPAGTNLVIDDDVEIGLLKVSGQLLCPETGTFELKTEGILVTGSGAGFVCGRDEVPFNGAMRIVFTGERELSAIGGGHEMGAKGFVAMNGGKIQLIAATENQGWVRLSQTAAVATRIIKVDRAVQWQIGDAIVIASSGYNPRDAEQRKITAIAGDGKTLTLDRPLTHAHWGQTENFSTTGRSWTLDERAEVVNLTRKIRLMSADDDAYRQRRVGAHMMIMGSGTAYVNGVEFTRVGQGGKMGRYPFHWHRRGDVPGQYIKNSSIHQSMNRCVTVHGTNFAEVSGNSCYDHYGHGFFLEDGNETKNKIINNIGILTKKVSTQYAILISDRISTDPLRFAAPATFWVANPDNDIHGNVAAGSDGSGFWMAFQRYLACDASGCQNKRSADGANVFPIAQNTLNFSDNIAHSSLVGITHDGSPDAGDLVGNPLNASDRKLTSAHYNPPTTPVFRNLTAYKNSRTGIYFRGGPAVYDNAILADNGWSFFVAFAQVLKNSVIVAFSQNHQNSEYDDVFQRQTPLIIVGVTQYDGPMALQNVHFANFSEAEVTYNGWNLTAVPFGLIGASQRYANSGKGITFNPPNPIKRFYQEPTNWADSWASAMFDVDGSLTGTANTYIVPAVAMNNHASCTHNRAWNSYLCRYEIGQIRFSRIQFPNFVQFSVSRSDGGSFTSPTATSTLNTKFAVILDPSITYTVANIKLGSDAAVRIFFSTRNVGALSPVIKFQVSDKTNCRFEGMTLVQSLASLRGQTASSYFRSGNDVYAKFKATTERQLYAPESAKGIVDKVLRCGP